MPANIRPPPGLALFHYPEAFDSEMEFQLRERNLATLEEMQNNAVDIETNLLIRRGKLKEEEREKIAEHLTYSEVKLYILVSTIEEMMQNITLRNVFSIQYHHDQLIPQK